MCPPLGDLRIFGFDTEDFVPFNSTFNIDAYSNYLLGVGYDNILQCYSLRNQIPAISRLENIALQAKTEKDSHSLANTSQLTHQHQHQQQQYQQRLQSQNSQLQQFMQQQQQPAALASLRQPPFYRPP